ncbi:hypothetical protein EVAR_83665_1 [Eumeta japonica]|uniref:Uncharacterized protein n=1 Tax=Eumeta variegata TaxID=151549 RepID=A0A4C1UQB0_EUMVA|nr:hypothetical protein EVAR_83665_1 [Eumeta japonica]
MVSLRSRSIQRIAYSVMEMEGDITDITNVIKVKVDKINNSARPGGQPASEDSKGSRESFRGEGGDTAGARADDVSGDFLRATGPEDY